MPHVSAIDYWRMGGVSVSTTVGSASNLDNAKSENLGLKTTFTTTNGGGPFTPGEATISITGNAFLGAQVGFVGIMGVVVPDNVSRITAKTYSNGGAVLQDDVDLDIDIFNIGVTLPDQYIRERNYFFWFDQRQDTVNNIDRVDIHMYGETGISEFEVGRIFVGNNKQIDIDAGWNSKVVTNSDVKDTVGGNANIIVKEASRELKFESTGEHIGSGFNDLFNTSEEISFLTWQWSDVDYWGNKLKEVVVSWRDVDAEGNADATLPFFSSHAATVYGSIKTSQGVSHISGPNFKVGWTVKEFL